MIVAVQLTCQQWASKLHPIAPKELIAHRLSGDSATDPKFVLAVLSCRRGILGVLMGIEIGRFLILKALPSIRS